ncbi:uncharacterized protein [Mytilus edulis]|uniref:uncharacterized protein n=1 Tax=Mytilus edulis TaxID=6550 RepID=UPI0039EE9B25
MTADALQNRLKDLRTFLMTSLKAVEINLKEKNDILQIVSSFRLDIEKRLNELEKDITNKIQEQYNTCRQLLIKQRDILKKQERDIIGREDDLKALQVCTNEIQYAQTIKTLDVSTHKFETEMNSKMTTTMLTFEPNDLISQIITTVKSIGNIRVSKTNWEKYYVRLNLKLKCNARNGRWMGFYSQFNIQHKIDLYMDFSEGSVTGGGIDKHGQFTIAGAWDVYTREIQFSKRNKGENSVDYDGQLSQDGCMIDGWLNGCSSCDKFKISFVSSFNAVSGRWTGSYNQYGARHAFMIDIAFDDDRVSGQGDDGIGKFSINGDGNSSTGKLQFYKQYHGAHNVDYSGQLSCNGRSMHGIYNVRGLSDSFTMTVT